MTTPVDITDPTIAKAYAHPLRIEIMGLLDNRVASPSQLAAELGSPLSLTSYHVRQLAQMGLVRLVRRRQVRGSIEHFYTAIVRPRLYDDAWASIPSIVKRALVGGRLSQLGREIASAAEAGGFERDDMHFTRTRMSLSPEGWQVVAREFSNLLARLDQLKEDEAAKLSADPHAERIEATVSMLLFESPPPSTFDAHGAGPPEHDDVADVAPPRQAPPP
jgi:DNA-binding transcriptional ArsR family regulator